MVFAITLRASRDLYDLAKKQVKKVKDKQKEED